MVRDRTEQLNQVRWRQQMAEQQQAGSEAADNKMLVVLNQQLTAAREDNQRLLEQITRLEQQGPGQAAGDDLTAIRGIGQKLVAQLAEYEITSFAQIAQLNSDDLEREDHPLHALRGRIAKDEWIAQAQDLCS